MTCERLAFFDMKTQANVETTSQEYLVNFLRALPMHLLKHHSRCNVLFKNERNDVTKQDCCGILVHWIFLLIIGTYRITSLLIERCTVMMMILGIVSAWKWTIHTWKSHPSTSTDSKGWDPYIKIFHGEQWIGQHSCVPFMQYPEMVSWNETIE